MPTKPKSKRQREQDAWVQYRLAHGMANSSSFEWAKMQTAQDAFFAGVKAGRRIERSTKQEK